MNQTIQTVLGGLAQHDPSATHTTGTTLAHVGLGVAIGLVIVGFVTILMRRRLLSVKQEAAGSLGNLAAEKAKSSLIINSIEDGVVVTDNKGIVRLCNPAAAKLAGWELEDTFGIDYRSILHFTNAANAPIDPAQEPIGMALSSGTSMRDNNIILVSKSNAKQFISISVSPIHNKDKQLNGVVAIFRDISKEKTEEQRRAEFISTASHEMRTPVAAIEGYLALALNNKVSTIDDKARSFIEKAHASTQHLGKLFQDLLTSAKAEDGRLVSHPQVIEMGDYLEKLVDTLRFSAEKKGLLMDFAIGASDNEANAMNGKVIKPLYYVHADPDRMREVITNLFDNAVKYTESGKISIGLTGNTEVVQFFIRDTGPGIPEADIGHLFQKFYRVDNTATRTIGGTGLGLFISRKIIELYKGRIWAESQLGKGSTFYINLPRIANTQAEELLRTEAASAEAASPLDKS